MLRNFLFVSLLYILSIPSFAISVSVQSPSKEVAGLGFQVNGSRHGGAGHSYSAYNMPAGVYSFGVRVNGIFGKDVGCDVRGQRSLPLKNNATVILFYNGSSCIGNIYTRK